MNELLGILGCLLIIALIIALYPLRQSKVGALLLSTILISLVSLSYWRWGGWTELQRHLQQQARNQQVQTMLKSINSPQELIDKLKAKVLKHPTSARGWYLLGRLYASLGQWPQARDAYAKAYHLKADEQTVVNYAQSLWQLNNREFNDEIRQLFTAVLRDNANQPDALAMLAMDAFLGHAYQRAIDYWQQLLNIAPADSEDAQAIRKAIAKAQRQLKI